MTRACVHMDVHSHPIAVGVCHESESTRISLIIYQVERTLSATNSSIAMAASKDFLAKHLLRPKHCDATMTVEDMKTVMENYANLASPNIKNAISNFKHSRHTNPMDGIRQMRGCMHKRLGHLHVNGVKGLQSMVVGMDLGKGTSQMLPCKGCSKQASLRSNNGSEYTSKAFDAFLSKHGIVRQTSAPYTPQQNGVVECANRTIVEMARCMLYTQGLRCEIWAEAVSNAVYTRNRCPNKALVNVTPKEAWSGKRPCISHMRVFGCIAYAKVPDEKRTKLDAKGIKCLFVGYCEGTKAYRLVCLESQKIIKSPDVVFFEDKRLSEEDPSGSISQEALEVDHSSKLDDDDDEEDLEVKTKSSEEKEASTTQVEANEDNTITRPSIEQASRPNEGNATLGGSRYPSRVRKPLGEWWMNHILPPGDVEHANVVMHDEPHTMSEAMQSGDAKKWELAMQEEYDSHGQWDLGVDSIA